ncbi:hypothetical protein FACS189479_01430 [Spirochaetia bacterium]|nr:hypothetical protein FACS189479_01430 [Spirochaetia bacterium]
MDMREIHTEVPLLPLDLRYIETLAVLRKEAQTRAALAELKGFAPNIPNQNILINAIAMQEAQESSAIENIVTTRDKLYHSLTVRKTVCGKWRFCITSLKPSIPFMTGTGGLAGLSIFYTCS